MSAKLFPDGDPVKKLSEINDKAAEENIERCRKMGESDTRNPALDDMAVSPGKQSTMRPYYGGLSPKILDKSDR